MSNRERSSMVMFAGIVLLIGAAGVAAYLGGGVGFRWYNIDGGGGAESDQPCSNAERPTGGETGRAAAPYAAREDQGVAVGVFVAKMALSQPQPI